MGVPLERVTDLVLILNTPKGRGVFSNTEIAAGTVIEVSPVLVLDQEENEKHIKHTRLYHYTYNWPLSKGQEIHTTQAVVLGLGSMFNHSHLYQNIGWKRDLDSLVIKYSALRNIKKGEELCISYGSQLTFVDSEQAEESIDLTNPPDQINVFK